jgi:hypothetical protein
MVTREKKLKRKKEGIIMRELNNKVDLAKVQPRKDIKTAKAEEAVLPAVPSEEKITADFSNPSAEVLGRSQVSQADALQKDVAFGMANPEAIEKADKFFDMAYAQTGDYAKASEYTAAYVKEFATK